MLRLRTLSLLTLLALGPACQTSAPEHGDPSTEDERGAVAIEAATDPADEPTEEPRVTPQPPANADQELCVAGVNTLAFALWDVLELPTNAAISPTSISLALSMVLAGADGETADELAEALGVEATDELHQCWAATLARWEGLNDEGITLDIANRLFAEETLSVEDSYLELTGSYYGAEAKSMNLRGDPEGSRETINTWVEEVTRDRIKDLLPEGSVHALTNLILVNALYLLADWADPFDKALTADAPFHRADGTTTTVSMMHRRNRYHYAAVDGARLVRIPYTGDELSMVIVLPDDRDGLPGVVDRLDAQTLRSWVQRLNGTEVDLKIPRFTIDETSLRLTEAFRALGVERLFTEDAELAGIIASEPTAIDAIIHKTFIKVDEEGTEAAAATAIMAVGGAPPPQPIEFHADHPFLFVLQDSATGAILFLGQVGDPKQTS